MCFVDVLATIRGEGHEVAPVSLKLAEPGPDIDRGFGILIKTRIVPGPLHFMSSAPAASQSPLATHRSLFRPTPCFLPAAGR